MKILTSCIPKGKVALALLVLLFCFLTAFQTSAQGTIRGKVTDENGEPMISATVRVKSLPATGAMTDLDGNFSLEIKETGALTLTVSYLGYNTAEATFTLKNGEVLLNNFTLQVAGSEMAEVVVTAKAIRANDSYVDNVKRKSATTLDYISSETMRKTGDANVNAAIARVSGVSTNGSFITVRGIGDRYVKTCINGLRIPTLDPFTNNIKLDIFPSSLVDNILITKTTSPDLPGDWSGAYISIETKDFPDKLSVAADLSVGFNVQNVFRNGITSQHSKTDILGIDNGLREYNHNNYVRPLPAPNTYEQFVGLGLQSYFQSIGVTDMWVAGTQNGNDLYKLGLVQLGLLTPAEFNDLPALSKADILFKTGNYQSEAFRNLNQKAAESGKQFANNWNTLNRMVMPNYSASFSVGNQVNLFKQPLGILFALRYNSNIQYDANATLNREDVFTDTTGTRIRQATSLTNQKIIRETNGWSALMNLAYKFNPNNSINILIMPNFMGVNNVRDAVDTVDVEFLKYNKSQFYEHRRQLIYQLKTEHYIPQKKLKIEFNAGFTQGVSSAPDFKNLNYNQDRGTLLYQIGGGGSSVIQRYFRYLKDDVLDTRLNFEVPIGKHGDLSRKIKVGAAYQYNKKVFSQYVYDLFLHPDHQNFTDGNLDNFFDLTNFGLSTATAQGISYSKINAYYMENSDPANRTFGRSHIGGAFAMLDFMVLPKFRINGGMRVEYANIYTDVQKYDSLGYAANDFRRLSFALLPNPGKLNEVNYLPAVNFIYKIRNNDATPINLRLNYSYNMARPTIRELTETFIYDFELRANVLGNPQLKSAKIHNLDLRLESYFKGGHDISVSFFYKNFRNHIELLNYEFFTWKNIDKSRVFGVEIEGKTTLAKGLELRLNAAYINSLSEVIDYRLGNGFQEFIPVDTFKRAMFGQAPYVVNSILTYSLEKVGFTVTASYNLQGPRLVISGISTGGRPDVFEMPRHLLDFKISETFAKNFTISLTARNLANSPVRRTFRYKGAYLSDFDRITLGQEIVIGFSYKL